VKFSPEEIIAALEAEEAQAIDSTTGELANERAEALNRYRGAPLGNEVEGRSQIVDRSVMDTIEWIVPSLTRIYMGGDDIGQFEPVGPEDEEPAKAETDVCNWYLQQKNDIFSHVQATLRDALLLKNGYMVGIWCSRTDLNTETYIGKTQDEVMFLMQDEDITITEQTPRPDPIYGTVYDVKVEMKKAEEYVQVESIPPDEMIVSRRHRWTSLMDCDFVEWVRKNVTIGQLRAEGFEIDDDEPMDNAATVEENSRNRFGTGPFDRDDNTSDPSRRVVTFRDAYIRMDLKGTGKPQLWRIARVSGSAKITLQQEANIIPFAAFSPLVYPHSHVGTSVYDLVADIGIIKTVLSRQLLDGLYLQQSGRLGIDINKVVSLDDLLTVRPGGMVRFDGDPNGAMLPIVSPDTSQAVLGGLEYMESQKEGRTGVTRYSAGLDANTLNKTATGVQSIQAAANQRIELIARTLASGFRDLFLITHALASQYCTKALQIKLQGKWTQVDPREWKKRTDFNISVGLGTGTPEQQLQKLMGMTPVFQQGMQMGLAGPTEAYNFGLELWKVAGYKNAQKFIHPPPMAPKTDPNGQPVMGPDGKPVMEAQSPPPQKDPMVQAEEIKAQASMQIAQAKQQADMQVESIRQQSSQAAEQARANADMQVQQHKIQTDGQLELAKTRMQLELDAAKHSREQETQIAIARIKVEGQIVAAQIAAQQKADAAASAADAALQRDVQGVRPQ
jgi:hypothetical protein